MTAAWIALGIVTLAGLLLVAFMVGYHHGLVEAGRILQSKLTAAELDAMIERMERK